MHPELFHIGNVTIHTYGVMIALGAIVAFFFATYHAKKELNIMPDTLQSLALWIIFAAFVGGKLFFYLEKPSLYFGNPENMIKSMRTGFVFYGSLIFAVPVAIWFFRKHKLPVWPMLDIIAMVTCIVHAFGRMGCFFAGCCYGLSTDSWLGVTFTNEASKAPLHTSIHPTQLYELVFLAAVFLLLWQMKRQKSFDGQLFFSYLMLYAIGRAVIEVFRGDLRRGFIIDGLLSHSQFISLIVFLIGLYFYRKMKKEGKIYKLPIKK